MTHNYSNISTLQVQSQKLKQIPNCLEPSGIGRSLSLPVVAMRRTSARSRRDLVRDASGNTVRITENPCDKIQLQLETINNQTYIIMEDVNLLKHKLFRGRGDRTMLGARRVTSFASRGKRIIASICSFLF